MQKAPQLLPFRYGTTRRRQVVGQYAITPGSPLPTIILPQVGMLARVWLTIEGTITQSAAGTVNPLGYSSLISRVRVTTNQGSASLVDVSGLGLEIINRSLAPQTLPVQNTYANAGAANAVKYKLCVPINANMRKQFEMGLINLQAPEVRVNLDVVFNPISTFVTLVTANALTAYVMYEYFDIPDPKRYALPPRTLVRTLEDAPQTIVATGDQVYQIPRLGTMFDYHAAVILNGNYCNGLTDIDNFAWRYNFSDTQYDMPSRFQEVWEAEAYNENAATFLKSGVISLPLWNAGDTYLNGGDFRDAIDTEENTTTQAIITINSGATITGDSRINHVRRVTQRIVG